MCLFIPPHPPPSPVRDITMRRPVSRTNSLRSICELSKHGSTLHSCDISGGRGKRRLRGGGESGWAGEGGGGDFNRTAIETWRCVSVHSQLNYYRKGGRGGGGRDGWWREGGIESSFENKTLFIFVTEFWDRTLCYRISSLTLVFRRLCAHHNREVMETSIDFIQAGELLWRHYG